MLAMFKRLSSLAALAACCGVVFAHERISDDDLVRLATHLGELTRVTAKPIDMQSEAAKACGPSRPENHLQLTPKAVIHVYVTPPGAEIMRKNDATLFPVGTVVLKQKFVDRTAQSPILYTGMLKHPKGFNPDCGDWEFFTMAGDGKSVTARGRIDSCMNCHKRYSHSDFVTKRYSRDLTGVER
jgi:hypothetical protein